MEGHKQAKRWIISVKDLEEIYVNGPNADNEILLWCDGKNVSCKRKCTEETSMERSMPSTEILQTVHTRKIWKI